MSFVLPGNARSLRFTGEAKALAPKSDAQTGSGLALGKPRVRKPPPPLPARVQTPAHHLQGRVATPVPSSGRDLHRAEDKAPYAGSTRAPVLRELLDSDENATMAMDRDALDVLPGGGALRTPKPMPVGVAPIPHFRPATAMAPATIVPHTASNSVRTSSVGAPLAVWVFAAILAGIISYHVAPEIMARLETPARATPSER